VAFQPFHYIGPTVSTRLPRLMNFGPVLIAIVGERSVRGMEILGDFGGHRERRQLIRHDRRS
jgi:hypothetical protein